ncbi:tetratricopeptide repeat protein [Colwellia psychrerythraea]|uniref:Tetratricopeptide TPR_1 repeat-containing protein n=1 Tax=Colwellia psychrerythraea TaxID=28229 RepID=A0A099KPD4_COLPS|nr:tetratricopeptide repeat protein [Colwellia psychrerythraea]KGJ92371.1 Tetratricopeptide TPR_1 repeat-containing protein [Colwellia psychrerythraea]
MSVINQMLKDLEQRSPESNGLAVQPANTNLPHSPIKIVGITAFLMLIICFASFYVWQLITENKVLRAGQKTSELNSAQQSSQVKVAQNVSHAQSVSENIPAPVYAKINTNKVVTAKLKQAVEFAPATVLRQSKNHAVKITEPQVPPKQIKKNNISRVTPTKKAQVISDDHKHSGSVTSHSHDITSTEKVKATANRMSVSRRQLSADELAKQKLVLAEKALAANQISKAEKLLEDAIIIKPGDSQTRKKLAALWFGRQAYQDAVNLLSQGISLNSKDSGLREMKARIYLKQGLFTAALDSLKPLAQLKNEQYQIMLANTAQQAEQNEVAVQAYEVLIAMQPDKGRWYLGLAVLYDKNSQFYLATVAYKKALTKNDLSVSSEQFVEQRLQAIGQ